MGWGSLHAGFKRPFRFEARAFERNGRVGVTGGSMQPGIRKEG